jgi:hypothetical protein
MSIWTLFSNHGHVLLFLAGNSDARLRDVAGQVGITERAVQKIVRDLQQANMLSVSKHGRRNRYEIQLQAPLRHALENHCDVGQLVELVHGRSTAAKTVKSRPPVPKVAKSEARVSSAKPPPPGQQSPVPTPEPPVLSEQKAPSESLGPIEPQPPRPAVKPPEPQRAELPEPQEAEKPASIKGGTAKDQGASKGKKVDSKEDVDQGSLF